MTAPGKKEVVRKLSVSVGDHHPYCGIRFDIEWAHPIRRAALRGAEIMCTGFQGLRVRIGKENTFAANLYKTRCPRRMTGANRNPAPARALPYQQCERFLWAQLPVDGDSLYIDWLASRHIRSRVSNRCLFAQSVRRVAGK